MSDVYKDRVRQGKCALCQIRNRHRFVMNHQYAKRKRLNDGSNKWIHLDVKAELVNGKIFKPPVRRLRDWKILNPETQRYGNMSETEFVEFKQNLETTVVIISTFEIDF